MHDYRHDKGTWNRSAIMSRGHEIARSLDDERPYHDRLSEGMTQAWAEAKTETDHIIYTSPADWQRGGGQNHPDEDRDEAEEIARYHSSRVMDEDGEMIREALTTDEFKEKVEQMSPDHIEATYEGDAWDVRVTLQGETLLQWDVADHDDEIMETCAEVVWPLAARVGALINRNLRHTQLRRLKRKIRRQKPRCGYTKRHQTPSWMRAYGKKDYVVVDHETKEIVHIARDEMGGTAGAIRSLRLAGIKRDGLELWYCEGSYWAEVVEPQIGDRLGALDMQVLTRHVSASQEVYPWEEEIPWETETHTRPQTAGSSGPPFTPYHPPFD
jgi:hypothetical protein